MTGDSTLLLEVLLGLLLFLARFGPLPFRVLLGLLTVFTLLLLHLCNLLTEAAFLSETVNKSVPMQPANYLVRRAIFNTVDDDLAAIATSNFGAMMRLVGYTTRHCECSLIVFWGSCIDGSRGRLR